MCEHVIPAAGHKKCITVVLCRDDRTQDFVPFQKFLPSYRQLSCTHRSHVSIPVNMQYFYYFSNILRLNQMKLFAIPHSYTHVYIPILPAPLSEVLSTPTPFIMGVHSSLQPEISDLMDVIVADIDGGSIRIPESLVPPLSVLPDAIWESTQMSLTMVLQPQLNSADLAFPSHAQKSDINLAMQDKEIRAVFMRTFAQLLQGYRSCLTLIRIHPKPVITFHKAGFLGARDLVNCEFLSRVLDSMFFTSFITERGPPWRACDAWDELYSSVTDLTRTELQNPKLVSKKSNSYYIYQFHST